MYQIPKSLTYYSIFLFPFLMIPFLAFNVPEKPNCSPFPLNTYKLLLPPCAFVHRPLFPCIQCPMYPNATHYFKPHPNVTSTKKTLLSATTGNTLVLLKTKKHSMGIALTVLKIFSLLLLYLHTRLIYST